MGQNKQLIKANLLNAALWADSNRIFCFKILKRSNTVLRRSILVKGKLTWQANKTPGDSASHYKKTGHGTRFLLALPKFLCLQA
jgi:hypothetical protein